LEASPGLINVWVASSGTTIGPEADTPERIEETRRLLYTWKDCFATKVQDIQATDLIEHAERDFANRIFLELEDAGTTVPRGLEPSFLPKRKDHLYYASYMILFHLIATQFNQQILYTTSKKL
jgi:hypothetical protein